LQIGAAVTAVEGPAGATGTTDYIAESVMRVTLDRKSKAGLSAGAKLLVRVGGEERLLAIRGCADEPKTEDGEELEEKKGGDGGHVKQNLGAG
jgi:hypothetical protein